MRLGLVELILLVVVLGLLLLTTLRRGDTVAQRLDRVERKVDLILDNLGINVQPLVIDGVAELLAAGRKIEAIKLYRERTGMGLKEAKDAVDRFQQMAPSPPGRTRCDAGPRQTRREEAR